MATQVEQVRVVGPGEGRALWVLSNHQTHKLSSAETNGAFSLWEERVPPQGGPPPHRHMAEDELFYVLAGELTFWSEQGEVRAGPGAVAYIPRGSLHSFKNTGTSEALAFVLVTPGGFERYFEAVGTPAIDHVNGPEVTPATVERLLAAAPAHDLVFELPA
jgi:quercetin dioxygenase-like cupin family protein